MNHRAETVWFGKHKGLSVADLISRFPHYALWAHSNVRGFVLTPHEIQNCIVSTDIGPRAGRDFPDWMEYGDEEDEFGGMSYSDFGNN